MQFSLFIYSLLFTLLSLHGTVLSIPTPAPAPQIAEIAGTLLKDVGSVANGGGGLASAFSSLFGDIGKHVGGHASTVLGKISNVFGKVGQFAKIGGSFAGELAGDVARPQVSNILNLEAKAAPAIFNNIGKSVENLVEHPIASMTMQSSAATGEGLIQRSHELLQLLESRTKSAGSNLAAL